MTAPDPGLTDLIAAEIAMHRFIRDEGDDEFGSCSCLKWRGSESFHTHVALAVKQHIARRIAELEASTRESVRVLVMERHRAEKAEATIARVENSLPEAPSTGFNPTLSEYDRGYERGQQVAVEYVQSAIKGDDSPAALEGEQQ